METNKKIEESAETLNINSANEQKNVTASVTAEEMNEWDYQLEWDIDEDNQIRVKKRKK